MEKKLVARTLGLCLGLLLTVPLAHAQLRLFPPLPNRPGLTQQYYYPYYGKNKINYEDFQWKTYSTDHFTIYFYVDDLSLLKNLATTAERAYYRVSETLKHKVAQPVPLIY